METEQQLISAIHRKEKDAKRRLYERFAGYATAIAQRYVPNHDEVHDVLQDSFVKILTSIDSFHYRGEGSLKAWIATIVAHQSLNYIKKHKQIIISDYLPEEPVTEEEPDVERIPPDVLNHLIGQLPTGYRMVLNLYVFEQLSHKEIGKLLGIKPETSASQYSRAKNTLARLIKDYLKTGKTLFKDR